MSDTTFACCRLNKVSFYSDVARPINVLLISSLFQPALCDHVPYPAVIPLAARVTFFFHLTFLRQIIFRFVWVIRECYSSYECRIYSSGRTLPCIVPFESNWQLKWLPIWPVGMGRRRYVCHCVLTAAIMGHPEPHGFCTFGTAIKIKGIQAVLAPIVYK